MFALAASAAILAVTPDPAIAVLKRCVRSAEPSQVGPGTPAAPPPGLLDDQVEAVPITGRAGAFLYAGRRSPSCGVALYGKVPAATRREIETVVASRPGWRPFEPAPIPASAHGRETGWGDPRNPTMEGAILYERRPSTVAPTIEVMRYAVVVP